MPRHVINTKHSIHILLFYQNSLFYQMGLQIDLVRKVKKISIVCIVFNLLLILISQCYLLYEARANATNNLYLELQTSNTKMKFKNFVREKYSCFNNEMKLERTDDKKKLFYENKYRIWYVTMVGSISLLEVFVDLPINILLLFAVYANQRKLIFPWIIFNGIKIVVTVVLVSLFVIYVVVVVDQFNSSFQVNHLYNILNIKEPEVKNSNTDKITR